MALAAELLHLKNIMNLPFSSTLASSSCFSYRCSSHITCKYFTEGADNISGTVSWEAKEGSFTWVFRLSWQMLFLKCLFSLTRRKSSVRMHTHCRLLSKYQRSSSCSQRHTCTSNSADNGFHLPIHLDYTILGSQCLQPF